MGWQWDGCHEEKLTTVWTSGNSESCDSLRFADVIKALLNKCHWWWWCWWWRWPWWWWRRPEGQVCVECVRLFGCLHSWAADLRGRTSHNDTQTSFALSHDKRMKIDRSQRFAGMKCIVENSIQIDNSAFQHRFELVTICACDRKRSLFECLWKLVKISQNCY